MSTDICSYLETSEVEAQFGEIGAVADGRVELNSCVWEVGGSNGPGGAIYLVTMCCDTSVSLEETFGAADDPGESIEGLGDSAWFGGDQLAFRRGDRTVVFTTDFDPEVPGLREKLVALAELTLDRL